MPCIRAHLSSSSRLSVDSTTVAKFSAYKNDQLSISRPLETTPAHLVPDVCDTKPLRLQAQNSEPACKSKNERAGCGQVRYLTTAGTETPGQVERRNA